MYVFSLTNLGMLLKGDKSQILISHTHPSYTRTHAQTHTHTRLVIEGGGEVMWDSPWWGEEGISGVGGEDNAVMCNVCTWTQRTDARDTGHRNIDINLSAVGWRVRQRLISEAQTWSWGQDGWAQYSIQPASQSWHIAFGRPLSSSPVTQGHNIQIKHQQWRPGYWFTFTHSSNNSIIYNIIIAVPDKQF